MQINLIAAIDKNYGIGLNNQLLCRLPADLKHFKSLTINHTIVMGRRTFESIGRVLPYRNNIVLSKSIKFQDNLIIYSSIESFLQDYKSIDEEIFVIGGEELFKLFLPLANTIYLTKIDYSFHADRFFPKLNDNWQWEVIGSHAKDANNLYDMTFYKCTKNFI